MAVTKLQVGDLVVMNGKYSVGEQNRGKIFTVKSAPVLIGGTECVFLEGVSGAYAADGLWKLQPDGRLTETKAEKSTKDIFQEKHKNFLRLCMLPQAEKDEMFNSGIFNDVAIGYGKIALEAMGKDKDGKFLYRFEEAMKNAFSEFDAESARRIYNRIEG